MVRSSAHLLPQSSLFGRPPWKNLHSTMQSKYYLSWKKPKVAVQLIKLQEITLFLCILLATLVDFSDNEVQTYMTVSSWTYGHI